MNPKRQHSEIGLSQTGRLDRTTSNSLRKIYQLCFDTARNEGKLKHYKKIKYMGLIYKIGEFVEIYHLGSSQHYVAKLVSIASVMHDENSEEELTNVKIDLRCPMIEVEWFFRKSDLSRDPKFEKEWKHILSDSEVFASGQTFALPVEAIVSKCEVLTLNEFWALSMIETPIYFTRSSYNMETETLTPSIEEWQPRYCICEKPYNPDLGWIECEKCKKWFHEYCLLRENQSDNVAVCVACRKREVSVKKKKK